MVNAAIALCTLRSLWLELRFLDLIQKNCPSFTKLSTSPAIVSSVSNRVSWGRGCFLLLSPG